MSGRPYARSTRTPCAFIPTSSAPPATPSAKSAAMNDPRSPATAGATRSSEVATDASRVTLALPNLSTSRPATSVTTISPADVANSATPSVPSLRCSRCLTAGIRVTQTPNTRPNMKKYVPTASRALRWRPGPASVSWPFGGCWGVGPPGCALRGGCWGVVPPGCALRGGCWGVVPPGCALRGGCWGVVPPGCALRGGCWGVVPPGCALRGGCWGVVPPRLALRGDVGEGRFSVAAGGSDAPDDTGCTGRVIQKPPWRDPCQASRSAQPDLGTHRRNYSSGPSTHTRLCEWTTAVVRCRPPRGPPGC